MPLSSNFKIIDTLHENSSTIVHRAFRRHDKKSVILKILKPSAKNERTLYAFLNEQKILENIKLKNVIRFIELISTPTEYIHVLEDIGGDSLFNLLSIRSFSLNESLHIALSLAKTLALLHQKFIIHADINPKNIIYNPHTKELQIIDFGHSLLRKENIFNEEIIQGSSANLFYISPEQTGLTKHTIDHRSDLYSLGLSLYHLFFAQSPFKAKDKEELLHKQIALSPEPLHLIKPGFPLPLSKIISKLIKKQASERYQNDEALVKDLSTCLSLLDQKDRIQDFEIALFDYPAIHIGEKLFGREQQISTLQSISKITKEETRVMVSGHSGVGKTRLVQEYFSYYPPNIPIIQMKFEQQKDPSPYRSFKQLFKGLISHTHKLDFSSLKKQEISILRFVFSELDYLLPAHKKYASYTAHDINLELPRAIKAFFKLVSFQNKGLIIFIDDLQWADEISIKLISALLINNNTPYLHFISSYRDNEDALTDNTKDLINKLTSETEHFCTLIHLDPLTLKSVDQMLHTLFQLEGEKLQILSKLLYKKTNGNPFYLKTLLQFYMNENELFFDKGRWKYELTTLQKRHSSINMVSLINDKFLQLSHDQQNYLQYLALLGNSFNLYFARTMMKSLSYNEDIIYELEQEGFIEQFSNEYQFIHDQIQQNIYNSISQKNRYRFHKDIAHFMKDKPYINHITYAYHLNHSYPPHKYPKKLFSINISALEELILHHAYANALDKVRWMQAALFNQALWKDKFSLSFHFSYLKAKVLYLNALQDEAYAEITSLIPKAKKLHDQLLCFNLLKDICVTKGEHFQSLKELAQELLSKLNFEVPLDDNKSSTRKTLEEKLKQNILYHEPAKVLKLSKLHSPKQKNILLLLVDLWEIAYYLRDSELMQWSVLSIMSISFHYGNSSESSFAYVLYGAQLASRKSYKKASTFGELALKLNHNLNDKNMLPQVHNFVANFINPYTKPLDTNISLYQKSLYQAKLNGNIVFGTWANFLMHFSSFLSGQKLDSIQEEINHENDFLLNSGDEKMISIFMVLRNSIDELQDNVSHEDKKEKSYLALWEKDKFYPALAWFAIIKAQNCLIHNKITEGLSYLKTYVHSEENEVIMFPKMRLHLIRALLLMAKRGGLDSKEGQCLAQDIAEYETYIQQNPKTFKFEMLLLKAEQLKDTGSIWDLGKLYDESIAIARKNKNYFHLCLASLCASRFFKDLEFDDLYQFYSDTAIVSLQQWGAFAPAKRLKRGATPSILHETLSDSTSLIPESSQLFSEQKNFKSLIKSFNSISKAQNNDELINSLMKTIIKNATASKAILVFKENDSFKIKAEFDFKMSKVQRHDIAYEASDLCPHHMLTYVINTEQTLTLFNPSESGRFQFDTYIKRHKPASSLVIPSIIEGSVSALLYLENKDIATPLNEDTRQSLSLLLTQASIVFKNTSLFESIKRSEDKLNKAQEISNVGSWEFNTQTQIITWSAETYRIYELEPFSIDLDRSWFSAHLHPDDIEYVTTQADNAMDGKGDYDIIHRIITDKGTLKKVHQRAEIFVENNVMIMSGTIQDITHSEQAKEEISRLSQVVDQSPYTTIITDTQGYISYANDQALIMSGYTREELIGHKMNIFRSFVHSDELYQEMWHTIQNKQEIWKGTLINKMQDGKLLDCQSTIFPIINEQHEVINYVAIQEDRTQENIKDKLFLMQTRQAQMGEMLSMIAHQWRQPLSIISALINSQRVDIMLENIDTKEMLTTYTDIDEQVLHLSNTISDFKDFFKPDKEATLTKSSKIINKVLSLIKHSLSQNAIEVQIQTLADPSFVSFESELEQVILNLFKNAEDAFIERQVIKPCISIIYNQIKDNAVITIEDNAKGIDKEVIDTLFLPYISTKTKKHGTGLGLYMSKTIVEDHCKGKIEVKNTSDGAKFTIAIPLREPHA